MNNVLELSRNGQEPKQADPQSGTDERGIPLEQVGISRIRYPVTIAGWESKSGRQREVEGVFDLTVSLEAQKRGIHMSRLIESLHRWNQPLAPSSLQCFLKDVRAQQGAENATMTCRFTWFLDRPAPETGHQAWQGIETTWHATQHADGGSSGYTLRVPVTTLCPCSRAISDYGAHSQRGWVTVRVEWRNGGDLVAPQEIFEKLQHAGSAPIYPLLKRPDERHVTMKAYEQPAFVEDTVRRAVLLLREDARISHFRIEARNEESIHTHDAIAVVAFGHLSE
ncbi:MAG: GTP cyclohydrolase FolE2 [Verrucomicrobiota bacterium]